MRTLWKVAIAAGGVVLTGVAGAALFAQIASERKLHRIVTVNPAPVPAATDAAAQARGKYLYESRGCADCHGRDGTGKTVISDDGFEIRGPNITPGAGSATAAYTDADWVRAIRHGVRPNGEPLMVMPSEDYNRMADGDLGALIGHVRALPPVRGDGRVIRLPLPVRFAYAVGMVRDAAEKIDHTAAPAPSVEVGVTVAYGAYVANMCLGCHGEGFGGGKIAGAPPDWPSAANLTPVRGGAMEHYRSAEALAVMLRSGRRPDGSAVSKVMPFESLKELDDTEVAAMYAFFRTLPPRPL